MDYKLRSQVVFFVSFVNTTNFRLNSLRYFASKVWNIFPLELKNLNDVEMFKSEIRKWEPRPCEGRQLIRGAAAAETINTEDAVTSG